MNRPRVPTLVLAALASSLVWCPPRASAVNDRQAERFADSLGPPVAGAQESAAAAAADAATAELPPLTPDALRELMALDVPSDNPSTISLELGEIQVVPVDEIRRVVIGDPNVADVEVVSATELFLQARSVGTTNLILWDRLGQRIARVEVIDRIPEAIEAQLRQLLKQLNFSGLDIHREQNRLFVTGLVPTEDDLGRVEQLLSAFGDRVTNLVTLSPAPEEPPLPSVKLTVQLVEMTREDTDRFGVDWNDSATFTETPFTAPTPVGPSIWKRTEDAFRFGSLGRAAFTPVLNMLVSNGKARILAEPKLVAASGKDATATLGLEVPIISATSLTAAGTSQSVEFKTTGVELKFKPTVLEDQRSIQLVVDVKVSSIDKTPAITVSGVVVPGFRVRQTKTEIVTESGATILISGLLQDEERRSLSQLPAIGSVPVLGNLFRSREFTYGKTELIVIVTPEIISREEAATVDRNEVLEQALASAEIASSVDDPSLRYALVVQDRIAKSIRFPVREQELGMSGRVKLRLHIFRDGTLGQATVSESSGIQSFDAEAMKAAESQSPYPAFPPELVQQDLWVEVPVLFRP